MLAADVHVRLQKRRTLLKRIEKTYEYQRASMKWRAAMPDPEKEMLTKRQWDEAVRRWRELLRVSGVECGSNVLTESGSQNIPAGDVGPPAGNFYPLLRMFTLADVQCLE